MIRWLGKQKPLRGFKRRNTMRHVEKALMMMKDNELSRFIELSNIEDIKEVAPVVGFTIQSDPVSEVGINGCQARDMLEYLIYLFSSLNQAMPNRETSMTITKLEEALVLQDKRTADRKKRMVEGFNKA